MTAFLIKNSTEVQEYLPYHETSIVKKNYSSDMKEKLHPTSYIFYIFFFVVTNLKLKIFWRQLIAGILLSSFLQRNENYDLKLTNHWNIRKRKMFD